MGRLLSHGQWSLSFTGHFFHLRSCWKQFCLLLKHTFEENTEACFKNGLFSSALYLILWYNSFLSISEHNVFLICVYIFLNILFCIYFCFLFFFVKIHFLLKIQNKRERETERWWPWPELGQSGASSRSLMWVQGTIHLGHPLLSSQIFNRELDQKCTARTQSGTYVKWQHHMWKISLICHHICSWEHRHKMPFQRKFTRTLD